MLEIKHDKFQIILALIVLAIIISLFFGKQTSLQKMQAALDDHKHENALLLASRLLKEEPGHQKAINVIKESGQILLYLQLAQSSFTDLNITEDKVLAKPEKVYEDFKKARLYTAKAKALDSGFNTTLNFEKKLDEAQAYVLNILATNVFDVGKNVYSRFFNNFEKKSAIINSAASSEYLDKFLAVQSAWTPVEKNLDKFNNEINPLLEKMDSTGLLISNYKSGKAEHLGKSLLSYIQVVKNSVDVFRVPKGSYKDYIKLANNSSKEYKVAQKKLKKVLSGLANANKLSSLVNAVSDYKLFKKKSTVDLIKENQYLQSA